MKRIICCLSLGMALTTASAAEVYKTVDAEGHVVYSDKKTPGAEIINTQSVPTYTPPTSVTQSAPVPQKTPPAAFKKYEKVEVVSPANEETIWDNEGNVQVNVNLVPNLQMDLNHKIRLFLNEDKIAEVASTQFQLANLDRGSFTLRAVVVDAQGREVGRSSPTNFHLRRQSVLTSPAAKVKS